MKKILKLLIIFLIIIAILFIIKMFLPKSKDNKADFEIIEKQDVCAETIELIYEDDLYKYYFNCMKSSFTYAKFSNEKEELVVDALKNKTITVEELMNKTAIIKEHKNKFKRTYNIINITQGEEESSYYLTLKAFQSELDTILIKINKELPEVGKNYIFEFGKTNLNANYDSIKDIFKYNDLISFYKTDLEGTNQINN